MLPDITTSVLEWNTTYNAYILRRLHFIINLHFQTGIKQRDVSNITSATKVSPLFRQADVASSLTRLLLVQFIKLSRCI